MRPRDANEVPPISEEKEDISQFKFQQRVTNKKHKRNNRYGYDLVDILELSITEVATTNSNGARNVDSDLPPDISAPPVIEDSNVLADQGGVEGNAEVTNNTHK